MFETCLIILAICFLVMTWIVIFLAKKLDESFDVARNFKGKYYVLKHEIDKKKKYNSPVDGRFVSKDQYYDDLEIMYGTRF